MTTPHRFILVLLAAAVCLSARPAGTDEPIVDSAMTRKEALAGLTIDCPEAIRDRLAVVDVEYYSTDEQVHKGQIVVDRRLAEDIKEVFRVILKEQFTVSRAVPVTRYGWDDNASMVANNTSGFNYRETTGGGSLSKHALGQAVDINPLWNPYIKGHTTRPTGAVYFPQIEGTLSADHIIVKIFLKLGWEWGGNWTSLKDYQHFEKTPSD